jgi:hypothetical protein
VGITLPCTAETGFRPVYAVVSGPTHGSLFSFNAYAGTLVYTPSASFTGTDSFTYRGFDLGAQSLIATVQITVGPAPSAWRLTAAGPLRKGATVRPVLKKPRLIGLVVFRLRKHKRTLVGFVPLGRHRGAKQQIHWNLKVNGKALQAGSYEVDLRIFTATGKPTKIAGPRPEKLVIRHRRVRVSPL